MMDRSGRGAIAAKLSRNETAGSSRCHVGTYLAPIATALVLMAVFIPVTSSPGTTGIVYKHLLWLLPLYRHFHLQRQSEPL